MTWNNLDPVHKRMHVPLGINDLKACVYQLTSNALNNPIINESFKANKANDFLESINVVFLIFDIFIRP